MPKVKPAKFSFSTFKTKAIKIWQKFLKLVVTHPLISFFGLLAIMMALIVLGNFLRKPPVVETKTTTEPKLVETFTFKDSPKIVLTAQIEKAGVLNVVAQTPGIVQKINFQEGERVNRGNALVNLSTNYQGGNAATLSRMLAQKSHAAAVDNFDLQKDIISKQRDLANKGNLQAEEMREINRKSIDDTKIAISLSEDIVATLDKNIEYLISTNVGGANDAAILGAKQGKAATLSGLNQLRAALRNTEYQTAEDKTPAQMGDASKDLTLQQLELQERSLALAKDISLLNLKLAKVSEAMMFPASPFNGVVEKVHVKPGQNVNPGMVIATIKADEGETTAVIMTSAEIARSIVNSEPSILTINGEKIELLPEYVSSEATDGSLHTIIYSIPAEHTAWLTNRSSVSISVPIGPQKIVVNDPLVPLDAIYQTQDKAYVYVAIKDGETNKVVTREVELAEVSGKYVSVIGGLSLDDVVILSRNVQEGEVVRIQ